MIKTQLMAEKLKSEIVKKSTLKPAIASSLELQSNKDMKWTPRARQI